MQVMRQDDLPLSNIAREFVGADHGGAGVCLILVDAPPGRGPGLHKHPYHEVFDPSIYYFQSIPTIVSPLTVIFICSVIGSAKPSLTAVFV